MEPFTRELFATLVKEAIVRILLPAWYFQADRLSENTREKQVNEISMAWSKFLSTYFVAGDEVVLRARGKRRQA